MTAMDELIRAAAGRTPAEPPPPAPAGGAKQLHWAKADGGEGRREAAPVEAGMSSLIRAQRDDIAARARTYEQLAEGRNVSGRQIG